MIKRSKSPKKFEKVDENTYRIDGSLAVYEVEKILGVQIPEGEYDTLSGYLIEQIGSIPKDKEKHTVETEKVTYYIEKCKDKRIVSVKACKNNNL